MSEEQIFQAHKRDIAELKENQRIAIAAAGEIERYGRELIGLGESLAEFTKNPLTGAASSLIAKLEQLRSRTAPLNELEDAQARIRILESRVQEFKRTLE